MRCGSLISPPFNVERVSHMHIGSVGIFEGPAPPAGRGPRRDRGQAPARPALPPAGALPAARARPPGLGRRPALQPRLPRAPHRAARAGRRRGAAQPRRPRDGAEARPLEAAVGDVDRRGPRRRPLGAGLQDAPLHGRRRLRHRPADAWSSTPSASRAPAEPDAVGARAASRAPPRIVGSRAGRRGRRARTRRPRSRVGDGARAAPGREPGGRRRARPSRACARCCARRRATSLNGPIGPHRRWAGRAGAWPTSRRSAPRTAARSTTSCSP